MTKDTVQHHIIRVEFDRFKAYERYTLHVRSFNILVGPNNAGKSTVLVAFRILSAALRKANTKKPEILPLGERQVYGYNVDLSAVSVAEENIFYNYDDSEPAKVVFHLSNQSTFTLLFPEK